MNAAPTLFRAGMRLHTGQTLQVSVLGLTHEDLRVRVNFAMRELGMPPATLLVCIPGGKP